MLHTKCTKSLQLIWDYDGLTSTLLNRVRRANIKYIPAYD